MNNYFVTSFSPRGYSQYGKRFIDSYLEHGPYPLIVFGEGQPCPAEYIERRELIWYDLKDDADHEAFCERNAGRDHPHDFNMMPVKFGHKVFAITSPKLPAEGWRVWIDADVEFTAPVEPRHLNELFPGDKALTLLGRKGYMRPGQPMYSECGFVGYNQRFGSARKVLANMRKTFTSDQVFKQGRHNWHDSYTFDWWRAIHVPPEYQNNISPHTKAGQLDAWSGSILSEFCQHHKGPKAKAKAYR